MLLMLAVLAPALHAEDATLEGILYRPFSDVAARYGLKISWVTPAQTLQAQGQYCTLEATANERIVRLNREPLALGFPILEHQGMLYLAKSDFDRNLLPLLSPAQIPSAIPSLHRIVIDPGHGGQDTGTANPALNTNEKINTLDTGLRLADELRKRGYEVILTHTKDVYVGLPERTLIANQAKADLYISVHFNHADQDYVSGVETWILPPPGQPYTNEPRPTEADKLALPGNRFDDWNVIAGFSIERAVAKELGAVNRGVKREHLKVLGGLNMPGLLIECGFLSNPAEGRKIISADYHQKIALAIADGVDSYKATLDHLRPTPAAPPPNPTKK
jgi:N-acetylmuramoyl-L-alanine amidase